jgi:hypothetical protein
MALKRYSGLDVSFLHVTHQAVVDVDPNAFDVVFHSYCARLCFEGYVSDSYREFMRRFHGLKVLAVQDEYEQTNVLKAAIKDLGFHVLLTCVPADSLERVFPRSEFPTLHFEKTLTGYVADNLAHDLPDSRPLAERPVTIGYRARRLAPYFGRLGQEKYDIGRRMAEICAQRGIAHDISMDDGRRIYGNAWFEFIGSCRSMIGTETGSNVFDWDGSLRNTYNRMVSERGGQPVSYEEFLPIIGDREQAVFIGEISPRIFECAVMRTPLILYRGRYSDAIEPDLHYISLEKDFSNIDEVLARLEDLPALTAMADRTFDHLVASGRFGYRMFAQRLRKLFVEQRMRLGMDRARDAAAARPASRRTVQEILRTEIPRQTPYPSEVFQRRLAVGDIPVFLDEVKRVRLALQKQCETYSQEMGRLLSTLRDGHGPLVGRDAELDRLIERAALDAESRQLTGPVNGVVASASEFVLAQEQSLERLTARGVLSDQCLSAGSDLLEALKSWLAKLHAEIADLHARFAALALRASTVIQMVEVERVRAVLCEFYAMHKETSGGFLRALPPPLDLEENAHRSDDAERAYRRARAALMPGGLFPDANATSMSSLLQDRLTAVNEELEAFQRQYTVVHRAIRKIVRSVRRRIG